MKVFCALLEDQRWLYDIFDISLSIFEKIESVKMFLIEYCCCLSNRNDISTRSQSLPSFSVIFSIIGNDTC